jgi:adenine-specific DNA-methyltransferase
LNQLIHGDNCVILAKRARAWREHFRLAYLDPPYNTGRTFAEYKDTVTPAVWAKSQRAVAELVRPLLRMDGALVAEIDDTELGSLMTVLDDVLGRENRVAVITVVRSAATGHKSQNRGPVNVSDFLLLYARDRKSFRPRPMHRVREKYDAAYGTFVENPHDAAEQWRFAPLRRVVAEHLAYATPAAARRVLGGEGFEREVARFALLHAEHVVRFAQPRYEAIAQEAQRLVDRSRKDPERVFVLEREALPPFILRGGNRILRLRAKVRVVDGEPRIVEPLTTVWDDLGFQGIAREGGVTFSRNKKPERLMHRIVSMCTDEGDAVLDPFAGSGTTLAVAQKMKRRFVGIEREAALVERCRARLDRVVAGEDATGVTALCEWTGGGRYRFDGDDA